VTADRSAGRVTIDLNAALAGSGALGSGVEARPGLAHPRAVAITNDGDADDGDETVYVTEFFSQTPHRHLAAGDSRFDVGRRALVYWFDAGDGALGEPIAIDPVAGRGLRVGGGDQAGCFPNQLHTAAIHGGRLHVTSVCESRRAPAPAVVREAIVVVDLESNRELVERRVLRTRALERPPQPRRESLPGNVSLDGNEAGALLGTSVRPTAPGFTADRAPAAAVAIE
jgi:hypothetical protein